MTIIDSSLLGNYGIGTMSDPYAGVCPEVHGINCPRFTASPPRPPQPDPPPCHCRGFFCLPWNSNGGGGGFSELPSPTPGIC